MFDVLSRFDRRETILILVSVSLVVLAPVTTYLLWPQYRDLTQATNLRDDLLAALTGDRDLAAEIRHLREEVDALEHKLHGDLAGLPAKEVEAYIVGHLQAISWRNRVNLIGVEPDDGEDIETFHEILFRVSLTGEYFDLYNWLQDLGNELGFIVIKQYQMAPINNDERFPELEARLTIAAYRTMT